MDQVKLFCRDNAFVVEITEGSLVDEREFEIEHHANSYAEGQCLWLGIDARSKDRTTPIKLQAV